MNGNDSVNTKNVKVWDLPLRLFHWLLVAAIATAFVAAWTDNIELHAKAGFTILGLLIFRLIWGFVGGTHARFANFIKGPSSVKAYLTKTRSGEYDLSSTGHNPLGALSVVALIVALVVQVVTGLFNRNDDFEAPLNKFISSALSGDVGAIHGWLQIGILVLVGLHVAAILFYRFVKRDNLVAPMITGKKAIAESATTSDAEGGSIVLGLIVAIISAALTWFIVTKI